MRHGIRRADVSLLNTTGYHPPGNEYGSFLWNGDELRSGRVQLLTDLATAPPNLLIVMGNASLHLALAGDSEPRWTKGKGYSWPNSIANWRGSIFWSNYFQRKCLATYHPAFVLRQYANAPLFNFDLAKIKRHVESPEYVAWKARLPLQGVDGLVRPASS